MRREIVLTQPGVKRKLIPMQRRLSGLSHGPNRCDLFPLLIDDNDIRVVFGQFPDLERRVRKDHQRCFLALLKEYEREAWTLNKTRIQVLMADGRWVQSWQAVLRGFDYASLCVRLRCAAMMRRLGIGNPLSLVQRCIVESRRLEDLERSSRSFFMAFPSA
jgi:hypothetical protein